MKNEDQPLTVAALDHLLLREYGPELRQRLSLVERYEDLPAELRARSDAFASVRMDAMSTGKFRERSILLPEETLVKAALESDAAARKILAKGHELVEGERVGVRLNINVLKNTGVAVQTLHAGRSGDGYTQNRGWWGGEAIGYESVVTLANAYFNAHQCMREEIAAPGAKTPMASVDGELLRIPPNFSGIEVRFNPATTHLFIDEEGLAVRRASEVTICGHRAYVRGEIEYYEAWDAPQRAGDAPSQARFMESSGFELRASVAAGTEQVQGLFDPIGNRTYLIASALSPATLGPVLQHEAWHWLRHNGLEAEVTLQELMEEMALDLARAAPASWAGEALARVPAETAPERLGEELAAYAVEVRASLPALPMRLVADLVADMRLALMELGWRPERLEGSDLAAMARRGVQRLGAGEAFPGITAELALHRSVEISFRTREQKSKEKNMSEVNEIADYIIVDYVHDDQLAEMFIPKGGKKKFDLCVLEVLEKFSGTVEALKQRLDDLDENHCARAYLLDESVAPVRYYCHPEMPATDLLDPKYFQNLGIMGLPEEGHSCGPLRAQHEEGLSL